MFHQDKSDISIHNLNPKLNSKKPTSNGERPKLVSLKIKYSYNIFLYYSEISISILKKFFSNRIALYNKSLYRIRTINFSMKKILLFQMDWLIIDYH